MTPWLLTAVLLSAAPKPPAEPKPPPPESRLVLAVDVLERVPVPVKPRAVLVDEWKREVRIATGSLWATARAFRRSRLCPRAEVRDGVVVAHCRNGQLRVTVERGRKGPELAIAQLRGLPYDDPQSLGVAWHYPPERFGMGAPCPGTTPEGKAECLVAEGRYDEAEPLLREALQHGNGDFAALRLGDLALARGDAPGALTSYQAAGRRNNFGRLAAMRLCELSGCENEETVFDSARLPEPLATEVDLRLARLLVLRGEEKRAALALQARFNVPNRPPVCRAWPQVCAGIAFVALHNDDPEVEALGLEVFLGQQAQVGTSHDAALLRAAAEAAAHLGAPAFAANLLATATPDVPRARMAEHLTRVATFYEAAGDRLRAGVVRDYARAVLRRSLRVKAPPPTRPDTATTELQEKVEVTLDGASATLELADALAAVGRSRASAVLGAREVLGPDWDPDGGVDGGVDEAPTDAGVEDVADGGVEPDTGGPAAAASSP